MASRRRSCGPSALPMKRPNLHIRSERRTSVNRRKAPLRVAVLIESSRAYGRGLLLGVAKYVHERSHWQVYSHERELQSTLPQWLNRWDGDGVIARIEGPAMAKAIGRLGVPVVDLRRIGTGADLPALHTDEHAVVGLALEHFLERGFVISAFGDSPARTIRNADRLSSRRNSPNARRLFTSIRQLRVLAKAGPSNTNS